MKIIERAQVCIFSFLLSIWILFPQSACGQDTLRRIEHVDITTRKIPVIRALTPSQSASEKDFLKVNAHNVADAIKNFSGVNIKDYGGIGGLKTVSVRSLGANHTGVFYDGVQLNDAQNGQVDLGKISLENIAEISLFIAQPHDLLQSARAYAFASALTLLPQTLAEKEVQLFKIGVKGGSFGLFEPALRYQRKIDKNISAGIASTLSLTNGKYRYFIEGDGSGRPFIRNNGDVLSSSTDASVLFKTDTLSDLSLRFNHYASDRGLPGAVIFYNDHATQRLTNDDWFVHAKYKQSIGKQWMLLSHTKFAQAYSRYIDPEFLNAQRLLDQRYNQREYYQSLAFSFRPQNNVHLSYAVDGIKNTLSSNLYQFAYPERFSLLQALAIRIDARKIIFSANLLHTSIHEKVTTGKPAPSSSRISPTIMVATVPGKNSGLNLRAFFKDVFRAPTFNDLYYSRIGNIALEPEIARQYNVGLVLSRANMGAINYLTASADVYYNDIKDKIVAVPNKDLFSWSMMNLGRVDIRGLDATLKTAISASRKMEILFSGNYTFQQALDVTDAQASYYLNQIPYVPAHTMALNAGLNYQGWSLFYNHIYASHRYYLSENLPQFLVPGFSVSDLSMSWQNNNDKNTIRTAIEVSNLFNTRYAFIRSFPMPGTSVRASIQVTF